MENFVKSYIQVLQALYDRYQLLVRVDDYELTDSGIFDKKEGYPDHTYRESADGVWDKQAYFCFPHFCVTSNGQIDSLSRPFLPGLYPPDGIQRGLLQYNEEGDYLYFYPKQLTWASNELLPDDFNGFAITRDPWVISMDFRVVRTNGNVYPQIWTDFVTLNAPLMCTSEFRFAPSNKWYDSFRHQIHLYFPEQWCDTLAQDRALVTAAMGAGDGMEELYNYCVHADGRQMLATENICRDEIYAPDLMSYTNLWPYTERYETIIRDKCARTRNTERCLLDSDSVERRLCGCFLPQSIVDNAVILREGHTDSNIRCWYPPCQSNGTVKTHLMIDAVCPNYNIAICNVQADLSAGGDVINEGELVQECNIDLNL